MTPSAPPVQPESGFRQERPYLPVYETLSRQRYGAEQLLSYLKAKRAALFEGNAPLAESLESGIARIAEAIALSMDSLRDLLAGQSLEAFADAFPEHMRAPLVAAASDFSRLEWLCLKELHDIKTLLQRGAGTGAASAPPPERRHKNTQANG